MDFKLTIKEGKTSIQLIPQSAAEKAILELVAEKKIMEVQADIKYNAYGKDEINFLEATTLDDPDILRKARERDRWYPDFIILGELLIKLAKKYKIKFELCKNLNDAIKKIDKNLLQNEIAIS